MISRLSLSPLFVTLRRGVGLLLVWSAGCQGPPRREGQPSAVLATLVIENLTDYVWTVNLAAQTGLHSEVTVPRRGRVSVTLNPGTYLIEQRADAEPTVGEPLRRELQATFDAGLTYEWPLRTLLSESGGKLP
ncbi:MAG: hypothetical protein JNN01_16510 [Opitutaceae bacterium]|nr:hypothetical protein [Opitutaceae bacterium]